MDLGTHDCLLGADDSGRNENGRIWVSLRLITIRRFEIGYGKGKGNITAMTFRDGIGLLLELGSFTIAELLFLLVCTIPLSGKTMAYT